MSMNNGRDAKSGRFTSSNPGRAVGAVGKTTSLQTALIGAVSQEDIRKVVRVLVKMARRGNIKAIHELLERVCPKPKDVEAAYTPTPQHTERTVGFFADLERMTGGPAVTPEILLAAYKRDYAEQHDDADGLAQNQSDEMDT